MAKLQTLKMPSGWCIDINNFYDLEPTKENLDRWFSGSVLIGGTHQSSGLNFDSRFEKKGDLGEFVLVLQQLLFNSKGKVDKVEVLEIKRFLKKEDFIKALEYFMEYGYKDETKQ